MKKVMTLSLAVILLVGTCVFIGLRTVKSDGYYDYGDDDEAAAEYYATYNFEDDYTTEAQTKYYPSRHIKLKQGRQAIPQRQSIKHRQKPASTTLRCRVL